MQNRVYRQSETSIGCLFLDKNAYFDRILFRGFIDPQGVPFLGQGVQSTN